MDHQINQIKTRVQYYLLLSTFFVALLAMGACNSSTDTENVDKTVKGSTEEDVLENKTDTPTFDYARPKPVNGKLKGVVELGAQGFNYFIVDIDKDKRWDLKQVEWNGAGYVLEGLQTGKSVTKQLRQFIGEIRDYGVAGKDIHFVVSSGAAKSPEIATITRDLKELDYVVNIVTEEEEGTYAAKCLLDESLEKKAFVLDIGSGNTKVAWMEGDDIIAKGTYGSKYYLNEDYDKEAAADYDRKVVREVRAVGGGVLPERTKICLLIGGIGYGLAKQSRIGKEPYTVLQPLDEYELGDQKMRSGINILQGILDGSRAERIVFPWDANFTIGFLLTLPY